MGDPFAFTVLAIVLAMGVVSACLALGHLLEWLFSCKAPRSLAKEPADAHATPLEESALAKSLGRGLEMGGKQIPHPVTDLAKADAREAL